MTLPIIGGDYGELKRIALAARAETLALRRMVRSCVARLDNLRDTVGTSCINASVGSILTLESNMAVSATKTIDGRDLSADGTTLDGHTTTIADHETRLDGLDGMADDLGWIPLPWTSWFNVDAPFASAEVITINQCSGWSVPDLLTRRFRTAVMIPPYLKASTDIELRVFVTVQTVGTGAGNVVSTLAYSVSADTETIPSVTSIANTFAVTNTVNRRHLVTYSPISGGAVADELVLSLGFARGDASDTWTNGILLFSGAALKFTPAYP